MFLKAMWMVPSPMPWAPEMSRFAVLQGPVLICPPPLPSGASEAVSPPDAAAVSSAVSLPAPPSSPAGEEAAGAASSVLAAVSSPWQAVRVRPVTRASVARVIF